MDMRNGQIYASQDEAREAGVPHDELITGTPEAIAKAKRLIFSKGSFKPAGAVERAIVPGPSTEDEKR